MRILLFSAIVVCSAYCQYPDLLWTHDLLSNSYGSPACADIDKDTKLEIVFGTYFNDEAAYALNAEDGSLLWRFAVGGGPLDAAPVIYDVDMDDSLEVIIPASWGILFCISANGGEKWRYPRTGYVECIDSPPSIADLDGDGKPEIAFGAWYGKIYVLNGEDGSLVWQREYCDTGFIQSEPCILDCNGDSQLDLVFGEWRGFHRVWAVDGSDGDVIWTYDANKWMYPGPAAADINLDGTIELVTGDYSGKIFALNSVDGSLIWETEIAYYVFPPVTIAELDNSSYGLEILGAENELYCLSSEGEILWSFPTGGMIDRGAIVAEVDGDVGKEVIFGSTDYKLYVVNGEDGSLVWEFEADSGFSIESAPIASDFDGDGNIDIFFIGGRGYSDSIALNYGRAYAVSAGPGSGSGWTMYRHDQYRSGFDGGGPSLISDNNPTMPDDFALSVFPNPFNSAVRISVCQTEMSNLRAVRQTGMSNERPMPVIEIYDLAGKIIFTVHVGANRRFAQGQPSVDPYETVWQPSPSVPSGVYLIRAKTGNCETMKRVVYLK